MSVTKNLVEIKLKNDGDFLKVMETLTRIGIKYYDANDEKTLSQSCHILHKKGKYYIVHFKEMFMLDGKKSTLDENDIARRNTICRLLDEWGLVEIVNPSMIEIPQSSLKNIKVVKYSDKKNWNLEHLYRVGK